MPTNNKLPRDYENNPFFVAGNGITLLFNRARQVGIFLTILSLVSFLYGRWPTEESSNNPDFQQLTHQLSLWSPSDWALAIGTVSIIGLAFAMVSALFSGVSAYTASQIAKGQQVKFNEAFKVSFDHLWSYLWLNVIIMVKILLWSLLLVVPGIIMAVRYSFADIAFFDDDKNLRGNAAIKESLRLTKGAWLTTYASYSLFNILTLGILSSLVNAGTGAILYRQFDALDDKKPEAHWLAWVTLAIPIILLAVLVAAIISISVGLTLSGQSTF